MRMIHLNPARIEQVSTVSWNRVRTWGPGHLDFSGDSKDKSTTGWTIKRILEDLEDFSKLDPGNIPVCNMAKATNMI